MKKETIWILPPRTATPNREYEQCVVTPLKCNVEGIVYLKNKEPFDADETYIAYDYKSGLAIVMASKVKDLIEKVEKLKVEIEKRRSLEEYKKLIKNNPCVSK